MDKVVVYIDGSNLYWGARENCNNGKVEINNFARYLANQRPLVLVKYFCVDPPIPDPNRFNLSTAPGRENYRNVVESYNRQKNWLEQLNQWKKIEIIKGRLQRAKNGKLHEKGVDVALSLHLVVDAARNLYDTAIVVSGDADLVMPIRTAREWGKRVEGVAFPPCHHISQACDDFLILTPTEIAPFLRETTKS